MSIQARFCAALLDPALPPPVEVTSWNGSDVAQRFSVYSNNVTVSLIEALATAFPVVKQMVGEAFFAEMARVFLRAHPPQGPRMAQFGDAFPAFLAHFEPVAELPYLPDLALLERLRTRAYHAADAQSLAPDTLAALSEEALVSLRLKLHPSAGLLSSSHAVASLWGAHQGAMAADAQALEDIDVEAPEEVLVCRPAFEVLVMRLPPGGMHFLRALDEGAPLGEAALSAAQTPGFSLADALAALISSGACCAPSNTEGRVR